ncbi:phage tail protein [Hymenobacter metallicola]|uniref:Fibronectin type-III domain-containing protein n=1 Tax=Hymenobacter metallicola TaxID=2563114 RepID=A0A4Z0Q143_9BACT|nr:hypothetical protein [Hymenobacter metallicola]TGE22821.1 hypothetical protein E5K02_20870 [Hymenobacter metallicola]
MALITLPVGITIAVWTGPATTLSSASWFTSTNLNAIYKQSANRLGYISAKPGAAFPGFASITPAPAGQIPAGYIFNVKTAFQLDDSLLGVIASGGGPTQLAAPANFQATPTSALAVSVAWSAPAGAPAGTTYVIQRATNSGFTAGLVTIYTGPNTSVNNTSGLTASTQYFYRGKAQATGFTDSVYSTDDATTLAAVATNPDVLLYAISQSNWSKLTERNTLAPGQLEAADLTSLEAQRTRSRIAITNTSNMQLLQLGKNGRSELTEGTPSEALAEGSSLLAWEFEKRSTGILNVGFYYRNGAPSEWFKKGTSLGSGYVYNTWLANCLTAANDFAARGKTSTAQNTFILIHQNESGGDLPTWSTDWQQIIADFKADMAAAGRPVPDNVKVIVFKPKTQTESGNLAQARANVESFATAYTAGPVAVLDMIGMNLQEEGVAPSQRHHLDMFSSIVEAKQIMQVILNEPTQVLYVSPPVTVSCQQGYTGTPVTRQAYALTANDAYDLAEVEAEGLLECELGPVGPYTTEDAIWSQLSPNLIADGNTISDNGSGGSAFARVHMGIGLNTTETVLGGFKWPLSAQLSTDGFPINNEFIIGAVYNPGNSATYDDMLGGFYLKLDAGGETQGFGMAPFWTGAGVGFIPTPLGTEAEIRVEKTNDPATTGIRMLRGGVSVAFNPVPITGPVYLDISLGIWQPYAQVKDMVIYAADPVRL